MAPIQFFIVNAFTNTAFKGNPATVCIVPRDIAEQFMGSGGAGAGSDNSANSQLNEKLLGQYFQKIAAEVSQVETAFVLPNELQKTDFRLRFFTKKKEMPFCGHATLAAAHILCTEYNFPSDEIFFQTNTGVVVTKRQSSKFFQLDLRPTLPVPLADANLYRDKIAQALGLRENFGNAKSAITSDNIRALVLHEASHNLIVVMKSVWCVTDAKPDSQALLAAVPPSVSKLTLTAMPNRDLVNKAAMSGSATPTPAAARNRTAASSIHGNGQQQQGGGTPQQSAEAFEEERSKKYAFVSRLFAPWIGIHEDAVSGASHAILAKYWQSVDEPLRGKTDLVCNQSSERGGEIVMKVQGDRVGVSGEAVTITRGVILPRSHL